MNDNRIYFPFPDKVSEAGERRAVERSSQKAIVVESLLDEMPPFHSLGPYVSGTDLVLDVARGEIVVGGRRLSGVNRAPGCCSKLRRAALS
jgi:hypothetical protein